MSKRPNLATVHCISSSESDEELEATPVPKRDCSDLTPRKKPNPQLDFSSDDELQLLPLSTRIGNSDLAGEKAANSNENVAIAISSEESNQSSKFDDFLPDIISEPGPSINTSGTTVSVGLYNIAEDDYGIEVPAGQCGFKSQSDAQLVVHRSDITETLLWKQTSLTKDLETITKAIHTTKQADCIKCITVKIDPKFLEETEASRTLDGLNSLCVKIQIEPQKAERSIVWYRKLAEDANISVAEIEENYVLVLVPAKIFVELVQGSEQMGLEGYITSVEVTHPGKRVTILLTGLEKCFCRMKSQAQRDFRREALGDEENVTSNAKRARKNNITLSRIEVEQVLVDMQICKPKCNIVRADLEADVVAYVTSLTKAIANAPYKKMSSASQELTWYAEGDSRETVKVSSTGSGLSELWAKQLLQFNMVAADTVNAIMDKYPCPKSLLNAYKKCASQREAQMLLADIVVRRGNGPLVTSRKVGPKLSCEIHQFFTCTEVEAVFKLT